MINVNRFNFKFNFINVMLVKSIFFFFLGFFENNCSIYIDFEFLSF